MPTNPQPNDEAMTLAKKIIDATANGDIIRYGDEKRYPAPSASRGCDSLTRRIGGMRCPMMRDAAAKEKGIVNDFIRQVYKALRPRKALTVPEIYVELGFTRSVRDISLALLELKKGGHAEFGYLGIDGGPFVPAWKQGPKKLLDPITRAGTREEGR